MKIEMPSAPVFVDLDKLPIASTFLIDGRVCFKAFLIGAATEYQIIDLGSGIARGPMIAPVTPAAFKVVQDTGDGR